MQDPSSSVREVEALALAAGAIRGLPGKPDRKWLVQMLDRMIDHASVHDVLHALTDVCYARAGGREDASVESWRHIARVLTLLEATAERLAL